MENNLSEKKTKLLRYLKWGISALVLVVALIFYEKPFAEESVSGVMGKLCNCLFVPGSLFMAVSALGYLAGKGAYDSFGYIFTNFSLHTLFMRQQPKKYQNLYEYKQEKDKKRTKWNPTSLIVGGVLLALSLMFFLLYKIL